MKKRLIFCIICLSAIASSFVFTTARPLRASAVSDLESGIPLPILMYHAISPSRNGKYVISPAALETDLAYLTKTGYTAINVNDLVLYQEGNGNLPEKPIILSFDDGSYGNYRYAFPLLKKYGQKAVMAVVGRYTDNNYDESGALKNPQGPNLTYEQIREMSESGLVEIQNHSYNCHNTEGRNGLKPKRGESFEDYENFLCRDLMLLDKKLEERANCHPCAVVYPFGAFDKKMTASALQKLGYKAAFTCTESMNYITRSSDLFNLKRFNRPAGKSAEQILSHITK